MMPPSQRRTRNCFVSFDNGAVAVTKGEIAKYICLPASNEAMRPLRLDADLHQSAPAKRIIMSARSSAPRNWPKGAFFAGERLPWLHLQDE